jgi:hypothetical protein
MSLPSSRFKVTMAGFFCVCKTDAKFVEQKIVKKGSIWERSVIQYKHVN